MDQIFALSEFRSHPVDTQSCVASTLFLGTRYGIRNHLDASVGGSFSHKTPNEGMEILDRITENNSFVSKCKPSREERMSSQEDNLVAESDLPLPTTSDSALESSPESGVLEKEEIQPLKLPFKFKDELFEDFENTSNYFCKRKPPVPVASTDPFEASIERMLRS